MATNELLPDPALAVNKFIPELGRITIVVRSRNTSASCPICSTPSSGVQSRYSRTLADLPLHGVAVWLRIEVRRFFCSQPECPRRIFAERFPAAAVPYGRSTLRLTEALRALGLALGGEPGAR